MNDNKTNQWARSSNHLANANLGDCSHSKYTAKQIQMFISNTLLLWQSTNGANMKSGKKSKEEDDEEIIFLSDADENDPDDDMDSFRDNGD